MPLADIQELMVYDAIWPLQDMRGDLQAGIIASTIVNATPHRRGIARPSDFMPLLHNISDEPLQTPEEMATNLAAAIAAANRKKNMN